MFDSPHTSAPMSMRGICIFWILFVCVCIRECTLSIIAHKFESSWVDGRLEWSRPLTRRALTLASSAWSTRMIQTGGRILFCVRFMEKTSTGFCFGSSAVIPLEVTYDCNCRRPHQNFFVEDDVFYLFLQKQNRSRDPYILLFYWSHLWL